MVGYGTDRFSSTISVSVPTGYTVIGSGNESDGRYAGAGCRALKRRRLRQRRAPPRKPARER